MRRLLVAVVAVIGLVLVGCVQVQTPQDPGGGPTRSDRGGGQAGDGKGGGRAGDGKGGGNKDGYAFMRTRENGQPVRWSTCRPIRYVVRPAQEPEGGRELLREAVDRIAEATGLEFSFAGPTDEAPRSNRPPYHPGRYGDGWSPVLVAWSGPDELGRLQGRRAGFGGPVQVSGTGRAPRYVSGIVALDADQLSSMDEESTRAVILHELAHVVGLAHVDDRGQLMHPVQYGRQVTSLQQGDLAGLQVLGKGRCYDPIEPRDLSG